MKKITLTIQEQTEKFLSENFKNIHAGARYSIDSLAHLSRRFIGIDLKGKFSSAELKAMLDVMNGTMLTPQFAGQHILGNIEDSIELDGLDVKWEINGAELIEKLKNMSTPERFFLEVWIQGFWEQRGKLNINIEDYIKNLL